MNGVVFGFKQLVYDKDLSTWGKLAFGERRGKFADVICDMGKVVFKVKNWVYMNSEHLV